MKLNKQQREALHAKFGGKCAYCGCELPKKWHADHIEPIYRKSKLVETKNGYWVSRNTGEFNKPQLDCIDNLNPSCPQCNKYKHTLTIDKFRKELELQTERLIKQSVNFRFALKYEQLQLTPKPIIFYFEKVAEKEVSDENN